MTDEMQVTENTHIEHIPFGKKLKSTRETLGLERKEVASQLHLNEKMIIMMENDRYPTDLPITFIRGYLRSYGKLLQIPEYEIRQALEPIKPKPLHLSPKISSAEPLTSHHYFMQFFTYLIVFTMIGLLGIWWYTHSKPTFSFITNNSLMNPLTTPANTAPVSAAASPPTTIIEATTSANVEPQSEPTAIKEENTSIPAEESAKVENPTSPYANQSTQNNEIENQNTPPTVSENRPIQPQPSIYSSTLEHNAIQDGIQE